MSDPEYPTVDGVVARLNLVLDRWGAVHVQADTASADEAERRKTGLEAPPE